MRCIFSIHEKSRRFFTKIKYFYRRGVLIPPGYLHPGKGNAGVVCQEWDKPFSYPEPFLRAVRRGSLAKSISELASDWLVLTQDIVFLPCFHGIRLWIWPEPLVAPRVRRALGTRMGINKISIFNSIYLENHVSHNEL